MSIISDMQKIMAAKVAALENNAATVTAPASQPSLKHAAESAIVEAATSIGSNMIVNSIGTSSVVKLFTAIQQLVLTLEEVKTDLKTNNPELWGQITSTFPALEKKTITL